MESKRMSTWEALRDDARKLPSVIVGWWDSFRAFKTSELLLRILKYYVIVAVLSFLGAPAWAIIAVLLVILAVRT